MPRRAGLPPQGGPVKLGASAMNPSERRLLGLCFFVSGACGLVLQVAWSKQLSYLMGNTLYAIATVVAAFMGGLGLGSALAARRGKDFSNPLKTYAGIEAALAVCGALSLPLFRSLGGAFGALYGFAGEHHALFLFLRFLVVFALVAVPATLMGLTLPVVAGALGRRQEKYEGGAGWLYGVNTMGAVAGTFLAGFVFLPRLGLLRSCLLAAALQGGMAVLAWVLGRQVGAIEDIRREAVPAGSAPQAPRLSPAWTRDMKIIGAVYALSGAAAMMYEVGWFRLLALALGPSVHAFSVMLGVYLAGVGLGSLSVARWVPRLRDSRHAFAVLEAALALAGLGGLALANHLPVWYFDLFRRAHESWMGAHGYVAAQVLTASAVVFAPTFLMGMLFPTGVRAFREAAWAGEAPEGAVGRLYALNTFGAIAGSLAAGFWMVPVLGMWRTLFLASLISLALALALWLPRFGGESARRSLKAPAAALAVFAVAWALVPPLDLRGLNLGLYQASRALPGFDARRWRSTFDEKQMLYYRDGLNSGVAVFRTEAGLTLAIGGKPDASTIKGDVVSQTFFGFMPGLFVKEVKHAAMVGYGSGMSAGALLRAQPRLESLDLMEIERGVLDAAPYFNFLSGDPLADPRTRLIVEDGRVHLAYTDRRYDVISSEPSNPWMAGVGNLFTADFYRDVKARLNEGGVFCQWIQLYQMDPPTFAAMLGTLRHEFRYVHVFFATHADLLCVASDAPPPLGWDEAAAKMQEPATAELLRRCGLTRPEHMAAHYLGTADTLLEKFPEAPLITDDNVWLEQRMAAVFLTQGVGAQPQIYIGNFADPFMALKTMPWADFREEEKLAGIIPYAFQVDAEIGKRWTWAAAHYPGPEVSWAGMERWYAQVQRYSASTPQGGGAVWARNVLGLEDLNPFYPAWRLIRFHAHRLLGRRVEMLQELAAVESLGEIDSLFTACLTRARLASEEGDVPLAWRYFRRALSLNPAPTAPYEEAADALQKLGDDEAWRFFMDSAERFHPEHPRLAQWRKWSKIQP
jgi:spermidine synthase